MGSRHREGSPVLKCPGVLHLKQVMLELELLPKLRARLLVSWSGQSADAMVPISRQRERVYISLTSRPMPCSITLYCKLIRSTTTQSNSIYLVASVS